MLLHRWGKLTISKLKPSLYMYMYIHVHVGVALANNYYTWSSFRSGRGVESSRTGPSRAHMWRGDWLGVYHGREVLLPVP